jgi:hypothetical protein
MNPRERLVLHFKSRRTQEVNMRTPPAWLVVTALVSMLAACASTTVTNAGKDKDSGATDTDTDGDSDSDTDGDSDSDSDSDADQCPYGCLSQSVCDAAGGDVHGEYECTTDGTVCCEIASTDTDTDTDTDADADTDADTDTDTGPGPSCTGDLQCVAHYPNIACCGNVCVNPLNNVENCGVCGNDCITSQTGSQCTLGECKCGVLSGACSPPTDCCTYVLFVWACDTCY